MKKMGFLSFEKHLYFVENILMYNFTERFYMIIWSFYLTNLSQNSNTTDIIFSPLGMKQKIQNTNRESVLPQSKALIIIEIKQNVILKAK